LGTGPINSGGSRQQVFGKLGELGLMGVVWPADGGSGMTTLDYAIVMGALARGRGRRALGGRAQQPLLGHRLRGAVLATTVPDCPT